MKKYRYIEDFYPCCDSGSAMVDENNQADDDAEKIIWVKLEEAKCTCDVYNLHSTGIVIDIDENCPWHGKKEEDT